MSWFIITALCVLAVVVRICTLGGRRPQVWWLAFTSTLVFIVLGAGLLWNEPTANAVLAIPNIVFLLSCLCFTAAAGSVQVYVHSLRHRQPSRRWIAIHLGTAVLVALVATLGWLAAPVHTEEYEHLRLSPFTVEKLLYVGVFQCYLALVLGNVAVCAANLLRPTLAHDHGRRVGLVIICLSAVTDVQAHVAYVAHLLVSAIDGGGRWLADTGDLLTLVAMFGIAAGTVTFVVGPMVDEYFAARRSIALLSPVWRRILEIAPQVALPDNRRMWPALRAERMRIEITDGLETVLVDRTGGGDPYVAVARALVRPACSGTPASQLLPDARQRDHEDRILLGLAAAYDDIVHLTPTRLEPSHAS